MINFKCVRYKNIFSVGNAFVEFRLDTYNNIFMFGKSGSGKSTIIDAITFALFGKAYRDINKGQIVNSINKKGMLVEFEFNDYKIVRGISPDKFEIWKSGELIKQMADAREYQSYLERDILKMDMKTLTQLVILGSAAFTPFMKLKAEPRRKVIEELLDLQVFRAMKVDIDQKVKNIKASIAEHETKLAGFNSSIEAYEDIIQKNANANSESDKEREEELCRIKNDVEEERNKFLDVTAKIEKLKEKLKEYDKYTDEGLKDLNAEKASLLSEARIYNKTKEDVNQYDDCPTCKQHIAEDYKKRITEDCNRIIKEYQDKYIKISSEVKDIEKHIKHRNDILEHIKNSEFDLKMSENKIANFKKEYEKVKNHVAKTFDVSDIQEKLDIAKVEKIKTEGSYDKLNNDLKTLRKALTYLKDDGIKKVIIDKYIPILNEYINDYLEKFDMFISFELDAEFNETIKSRYRDKFTYNSFSEGQKRRIDFSIMMAFREIAKMRNSVSCNFLIVDELLDGLDTDNVDNLESIIAGFNDTNTLFISHSEDMKNRAIFDCVYKAELVGNFTEYEELS